MQGASRPGVGAAFGEPTAGGGVRGWGVRPTGKSISVSVRACVRAVRLPSGNAVKLSRAAFPFSLFASPGVPFSLLPAAGFPFSLENPSESK